MRKWQLRSYTSQDIQETCARTNWFKTFCVLCICFYWQYELFLLTLTDANVDFPAFTERPCAGLGPGIHIPTRRGPHPQVHSLICARLIGSWGFSQLCHCFLKRDLRSSVFQLWEIGDLSGSQCSFVQQMIFSEWLLYARHSAGSGDAKMCKTWSLPL